MLKRRMSFLLLIFLVAAISVLAQQRRIPAVKGPQKVPAAVEPAPTFDTLLASDSYKIYGEIRGVGQVIGSSSVNELLEPIMKLAGPPKEFKTLVRWLNAHADAVMTSRMLIAGWPRRNNLPEMLVAIEFASPEEAAKFEPQLNDFLPKVLPTPEPEDTPSPSESKNNSSAATPKPEKPKESPPAAPPSPPKPNYYLKQAGSLLFITPGPLTLKNLRPPGSKLLAEDPNFRIIHDRFNSEAVFVYVDVKGIEKEEEERRQQYKEEEQKRRETERKKTLEDAAKLKTAEAEGAKLEGNNDVKPEEPASVVLESFDPKQSQEVGSTLGSFPEKPAAELDPMTSVFSMLPGTLFSGEPTWPEAIGFAITFDANSFDVRALLINAPDVKGTAIPFVPQLISGPALIPESPSILPADTELFATMSLDLPQMYVGMIKASQGSVDPRGVVKQVKETETESPFASLEKKLGIKIKDDLLPLLGNEVVFSMPVKGLGPRPNGPMATPTPTGEKEGTAKERADWPKAKSEKIRRSFLTQTLFHTRSSETSSCSRQTSPQLDTLSILI